MPSTMLRSTPRQFSSTSQPKPNPSASSAPPRDLRRFCPLLSQSSRIVYTARIYVLPGFAEKNLPKPSSSPRAGKRGPKHGHGVGFSFGKQPGGALAEAVSPEEQGSGNFKERWRNRSAGKERDHGSRLPAAGRLARRSYASGTG